MDFYLNEASKLFMSTCGLSLVNRKSSGAYPYLDSTFKSQAAAFLNKNVYEKDRESLVALFSYAFEVDGDQIFQTSSRDAARILPFEFPIAFYTPTDQAMSSVSQTNTCSSTLDASIRAGVDWKLIDISGKMSLDTFKQSSLRFVGGRFTSPVFTWLHTTNEAVLLESHLRLWDYYFVTATSKGKNPLEGKYNYLKDIEAVAVYSLTNNSSSFSAAGEASIDVNLGFFNIDASAKGALKETERVTINSYHSYILRDGAGKALAHWEPLPSPSAIIAVAAAQPADGIVRDVMKEGSPIDAETVIDGIPATLCSEKQWTVAQPETQNGWTLDVPTLKIDRPTQNKDRSTRCVFHLQFTPRRTTNATENGVTFRTKLTLNRKFDVDKAGQTAELSIPVTFNAQGSREPTPRVLAYADVGTIQQAAAGLLGEVRWEIPVLLLDTPKTPADAIKSVDITLVNSTCQEQPSLTSTNVPLVEDKVTIPLKHAVRAIKDGRIEYSESRCRVDVDLAMTRGGRSVKRSISFELHWPTAVARPATQ